MASKDTDTADTFNYNEARKVYFQKIIDLFTLKPNHKYLDRIRMRKVFKMVSTAKLNIANGCQLSQAQEKALKYFDILITETSTSLIKARKSEEDRIVTYFSCEDAFDIILEAHRITDHGNMEKILKYTKNKYVINKKCIEIFLPLCCGVDRSKATKYNFKSYVFLIEIVNIADDPFHFILVVRDAGTGFTHLRPVMKSDPTEVAIELFKIFTDFGPPFILAVNDLIFFRLVNEVLKSLCPEFKIEIQANRGHFKVWSQQVLNCLQEWSEKANTKKWASGCLMAQWKINNTPETKSKSKPFVDVFGLCSSDPFRFLSNQVTTDVPIEVSDDSDDAETDCQTPSTAPNFAVSNYNIILNSNSQTTTANKTPYKLQNHKDQVTTAAPDQVTTAAPELVSEIIPVPNNANAKSNVDSEFNKEFQAFVSDYTEKKKRLMDKSPKISQLPNTTGNSAVGFEYTKKFQEFITENRHRWKSQSVKTSEAQSQGVSQISQLNIIIKNPTTTRNEGCEFNNEFENFIQYSKRGKQGEAPSEKNETTTDVVNENIFQDDNAKISVVSVQISDSEMDVDDDYVKECICCNGVMDVDCECNTCKKPVHSSCGAKMRVKQELVTVCRLCFVKVKSRIDDLKRKIHENSESLEQKV